MNRIPNFCVAASLVLGSLSGTAMAQKGPPEGRGSAPTVRAETPQFRLPSTRQVREWAIEDRLTGQKALPPGIRKNLARGKPLPPGIAKQMAPQPLLVRMPRYEGYDWRVAGADVVLVEVATQVVVDVLLGVLE